MNTQTPQNQITIRITDKKLLVALIVVALWGGSLWAVCKVSEKNILAKHDSDETSQYPYLNPRLRNLSSEERERIAFNTLIPLREKLFAFLGDKKEHVSFYVEDLNSGAWSGWQEREDFIPASLLKVPVAIGAMNKVDDGEWSLDKTFEMKEQHKDKRFGNLWKKADGEKIKISELIEEMLGNSDNTAANILFHNLTPQERDDIYYQIGLPNPEILDPENENAGSFRTLSARNLATMFRALYNATYLNRESSNYLIGILAATKFGNLVSEDIPQNVKVAHKMGELTDDPGKLKNYHDCGITYVPDHPYLYCIMTKDFSHTDAPEVIREMNRTIYEHFALSGKK